MTVAGKKYVDCIVLGTDSVDAEDSSYDSDFEAEDSVGSTNSHSQVDLQVSTPKHSSVFRTTSDTLAAEYAEYVTVQGSPPVPSPGYTARVEFALKLGYTERLVQTAMEKLGPDPEQNELLAELIKLGASRSPKSVVTTEESDSIVDTDFGFNENSTSPTALRPVVIDGSNVAMSHGNKKIFSCRGIRICVDWFRARGHTEITVFVPKWRKEAPRIDNPITDQEILEELERDRLLVFTPSRLIGGKRMVCYDDRYILKLAAEIDGIVVSNDNYRDLALENSEFRKVIEERILMYTFVNDRFMPPDDPLGRSGPTLNNFLKAYPTKTDPATPCPYAKKCTYGNKCKFRHPERGCYPQKSVTEKLEEHVQKHLHLRGSASSPVSSNNTSTTLPRHKPLCKTGSTISTTTHNQALLSVTKSKSAENVGIQPPIKPVVHRTQALPTTSSQAFPSSHRSLGRMSKPDTEQLNKHKILQRQLGSSTAAQIRQMEQALDEPEWGSSSQQNTIAASRAQRRPLTRHSSNELPYRSARRDHAEESQHHHHVRRNVSAPDYPQPDYSIPDSEIRSDILYNRLYDTLPREEVIDLLIERRQVYEICSVLYAEGLVRRAMLLVPFEVNPEEVFDVIKDILFTKPFKQ